jgi:predicted phage gp36 major capsid-like protein
MPDNNNKEDATIQVIAERISSLHGDVTDLRNDMRESYKEMSEAIKSLIRLEEKQMNLYSHYEEIKKEQNIQEKRLDALEKSQPETQRIIGIAYKALWLAAAAAVSFVAKAVGLI